MGSQIVTAMLLIALILSLSAMFVPLMLSGLFHRSISLSKAEEMMARRSIELLTLVHTDIYAGGIVLWVHNYGGINVDVEKIYSQDGSELEFRVSSYGELSFNWTRVDYEVFDEGWSERWETCNETILYGSAQNATTESIGQGLLIEGAYQDSESCYVRRRVYGSQFRAKFTSTPAAGDTSIAVFIFGYEGWIYVAEMSVTEGVVNVLYGKPSLIARIPSLKLQPGSENTVEISVRGTDVSILVSNSTATMLITLPNRDRLYWIGFLQGGYEGASRSVLHSVEVVGPKPCSSSLDTVIEKGLQAVIIYSNTTPQVVYLVSSNLGVFSWHVLPRE